jgi:polar amino acid transport system substrate-binding protein
MKRSISVLVAVCMAIGLILAGCASANPQGTAAADDSWTRIKEQGYFIAGCDDAFPPMTFRDDNNAIVGFDVDLAKEVAKRMGVEVRFQPAVWDTIAQELNKGTIDVVWSGYSISEDRQKVVDFTKPYMDNQQIVVVLKDSPYQTLEDLSGKKLAIQQGSTANDALDANAEFKDSLAEVVPFDDNTKAFLDLDSERVDCLAVDIVVYNYYFAKGSDKYRMLETPLGSEKYGVGVRKEDDAFTAELQKAIDAVYADGTAGKISEDWFGEDIVSEGYGK